MQNNTDSAQQRFSVVLLLQDMWDIVTRDIMIDEIRDSVQVGRSSNDSGMPLFAGTDAVVFPPPKELEERVCILHN